MPNRTRQRRSPRFRPCLVAISLFALVGLAACDSATPSASPEPTESTASMGPSADPSGASPDPSGASPDPNESVEPTRRPVTQTETEWGWIWDRLPEAFPRVPGSVPAVTREGPVTAEFLVVAEAGPAATDFQTRLEMATFSTLALSGPFEDGGYVIDSAGEGECLVQTSFRPFEGATLMRVFYGADCPFDE